MIIALFLSSATQTGRAAEQSSVAELQQQQLEALNGFRDDHQFAQMQSSTQQGYSHFKKYSPFYLRSHPNERARGDIADIQMLAMQTGANELEGVENVFEKNIGNFEKLVTGAAAGDSHNQ